MPSKLHPLCVRLHPFDTRLVVIKHRSASGSRWAGFEIISAAVLWGVWLPWRCWAWRRTPGAFHPPRDLGRVAVRDLRPWLFWGRGVVLSRFRWPCSGSADALHDDVQPEGSLWRRSSGTYARLGSLAFCVEKLTFLG